MTCCLWLGHVVTYLLSRLSPRKRRALAAVALIACSKTVLANRVAKVALLQDFVMPTSQQLLILYIYIYIYIYIYTYIYTHIFTYIYIYIQNIKYLIFKLYTKYKISNIYIYIIYNMFENKKDNTYFRYACFLFFLVI